MYNCCLNFFGSPKEITERIPSTIPPLREEEVVLEELAAINKRLLNDALFIKVIPHPEKMSLLYQKDTLLQELSDISFHQSCKK